MPAQPDIERQAKAQRAGEIPRDAVLEALNQVVSSEAFAKTERPARFLRFVVETALRGESPLLKENVLGVEVFDRPASWDPRLDPVVRQEAGRLRKRLAKYYDNGGADSEVRIELPVGTYVPVFRRKPVEIEPAPIQTLAPEQVPVARSRAWLYATAGILFVAGAFIAWRGFSSRQSAPSIAVLPFANLSADPANQYFSDGLTDEITDSLARVKALRVIARSSASQFKGKRVDIREVGRLLNVANVLEGSVARSGDRVKIIAHLERVSDGSLLWSDTYERKASDLFAVQSELAAGIAGGLKVATGIPSTTHVPNAEANEFFMKGRYDLQQVTPDAAAQAELDYQHAIDKDPAYAPAYLGLANAKYNQSIARGSSYQTEAELKGVQSLLFKALQLDPGLPGAHSLAALLAMQHDRDWARAERELQLALTSSSSAAANRDYAFFLLFHGRFPEADLHFARMAELDPYSTATESNLALARILEGRFVEAREISQKAAAENPRMLWTQQLIGLTYVEDGRPELALPIFRKLKQRFPPAQVCEAMALAKEGQKDEALRLIRPFEEKYPNSGIAMEWLALVYAFMGDEPNTVKWLQRSADLHEFQALSLAVDPAYAPMRNSPEFQALEKRMGLN
jgi:TolB-like protein/tetratricopeptide (TPR) repeat protein